VAQTCGPSYKVEWGGKTAWVPEFKNNPGNIARPRLKNKERKRTLSLKKRVKGFDSKKKRQCSLLTAGLNKAGTQRRIVRNKSPVSVISKQCFSQKETLHCAPKALGPGRAPLLPCYQPTPQTCSKGLRQFTQQWKRPWQALPAGSCPLSLPKRAM
jgi:hypothetical protein